MAKNGDRKFFHGFYFKEQKMKNLLAIHLLKFGFNDNLMNDKFRNNSTKLQNRSLKSSL